MQAIFEDWYYIFQGGNWEILKIYLASFATTSCICLVKVLLVPKTRIVINSAVYIFCRHFHRESLAENVQGRDKVVDS